MWVFTKRVFLSAVAYDPKKDIVKGSLFKKFARNKYTHVLVRARVKEDLEDLRIVVPNVVVVDDKVADYRYRAVISRWKWKQYLNYAVDEMDYDSHFKEVVRENATQGEQRYTELLKVWAAMANLQPYSYPSGSWGKSGKSGKSGKGSIDLPDWSYPTVISPTGTDSLLLDEVDRLYDEEQLSGAAEGSPSTVDAGELSLDDAALLVKTTPYPGEFLSPDDIARSSEDAFELWARLMDLRKRLGESLVVDDEVVDLLVHDIRSGSKSSLLDALMKGVPEAIAAGSPSSEDAHEDEESES